jgi:hypothetical protein
LEPGFSHARFEWPRNADSKSKEVLPKQVIEASYLNPERKKETNKQTKEREINK